MKGLFAGSPFTYQGRHYRVDALAGQPTPRQRPHPLILLGGGGQRLLSLAAREADIVGINVASRTGQLDRSAGGNGPADATDQKPVWIRAAAGPRFPDLELGVVMFVVVVTEHCDAAGRPVGVP